MASFRHSDAVPAIAQSNLLLIYFGSEMWEFRYKRPLLETEPTDVHLQLKKINNNVLMSWTWSERVSLLILKLG